MATRVGLFYIPIRPLNSATLNPPLDDQTGELWCKSFDHNTYICGII